MDLPNALVDCCVAVDGEDGFTRLSLALEKFCNCALTLAPKCEDVDVVLLRTGMDGAPKLDLGSTAGDGVEVFPKLGCAKLEESFRVGVDVLLDRLTNGFECAEPIVQVELVREGSPKPGDCEVCDVVVAKGTGREFVSDDGALPEAAYNISNCKL